MLNSLIYLCKKIKIYLREVIRLNECFEQSHLIKKSSKMKKFMLDIQLEGLDHETRMKLLPREQEVVKELEQDGTIVDTFIKLDMSGIFIVMMAADSDDVHTKLSTLPYYPYMKIQIVPVRVVNSINQ